MVAKKKYMFDGKPGIYTGSVKVKGHPVLGANMYEYFSMHGVSISICF